MGSDTAFEKLARVGYGTRGIVYLLVGGLALLSVFGGGSDVDSRSALNVVLRQPFGQAWLWVIAAGLLGFVLWRLAQALLDADNHGKSLKGLAVRGGLLVSAVTYGALAFYAARNAMRFASESGGSGNDGLVAWLMGQPYGRYLVGAVGLAIAGAGIAHISKGLTHGYRKYFDARARQHSLIEPVCTYGLAARGVLFVVIGGLFIFAAVVVQPEQAGTLSEAMSWLRNLPFGALIYAAAALGLFAFGAYGLIEARYRHVDGPSLADVKQAAT